MKATGTVKQMNLESYASIHLISWRGLRLVLAGQFPSEPTDMLLLLYEFEARAKLNDPQVETVLESVLELKNVDPKMLETMAGLKQFAHISSINF